MHMLVSFLCSSCEVKLEVDATATGTVVQCPECNEAITVPKVRPGPGTTIHGFKVEALLGKGGMGEVYLAKQISMDRNIALKILPPQFAMNEEDVQRFLKEVRMAARLEHPNVVRAYEAGEDHDVYFLAMAFVDGETVTEKLDREGAMSEREALQIIRKAASALQYAWNEHRIIHRDIKPSNIMINRRGEPLLADLGLSKSVDEVGMTMSGAVMGTPNYMSPEQAEGHVNIDFRCDIYSLGATLYHMLTGLMPFYGSSVMDVLRKQLTEDLSDPRETNPDVSKATVDLMERMLAKSPDNRHADWGEVIGEIDGILSGHPSLHAPMASGQSVMIRARDTSSGDATLVGETDPSEPAVAEDETILTATPPSKADQVHAAGARRPRKSAPPAKKSKAPLIAGVAVGGVLILGLAVWGVTSMGGKRRPVAPQTAAAQGEQHDKIQGGKTTAAIASAARKEIAVRPEAPAVASPKVPTTAEELHAAIKAANPDYNGKGQFKISGGQIVEAILSETGITDVSPLRGLPLSLLKLTRTEVADISPLKGMPLKLLQMEFCPNISDLSPLEGMPLEMLWCGGGTKVSDLSPLKGLPLKSLVAQHCPVQDLEPLRGMNLQGAHLFGTQVEDLSPLSGMSFKSLTIHSTPIRDISPLKGMPLETLSLDPGKITEGIDVLRDMKTLKHIDVTFPFKLSAAGFWRKYDAGAFGKPAAASKKVPTTAQELHAAIKAANPGYNGKGQFKISGGRIVDAKLMSTGITDLSPLKGMSLESLNIGGNDGVTSLSPLAGMTSLTDLGMYHCGVASLEPLRGLKITRLDICGRCPVTNISPLKGMPINTLWLAPGVSDLTPLIGMPLRDLGLYGDKISDLTPLTGMKLEKFQFNPASITRGIEVIRTMSSLKRIGVGKNWPSGLVSPTDFWRKYDAGELN